MPYSIPLIDVQFGEEEVKNVTEAVRSGWISSKGAFIGQFEREYAAKIGTAHGVATSNGTTALHLAMEALGIGKGDEVIVPSFTFIASANTVKYTGAKPVFVDSHKDYWCMDPAKIEKRITKRTKAIMPVHIYGHPCDMDPIMEIARKHDLWVIEDAAEAHGAQYKGKNLGTFGDVACYSFYGNKVITTGEGGICLTNDKELDAKMRVLRDHGMNPNRRYWHDVVGYNYRMTNLNAAIGVAQLKRLDFYVERRREVAKWYAEEFADLVKKGYLEIHPEMEWAKCIYWLYGIVLRKKAKCTRDELMAALEQQHIESRPMFYPVTVMPPYEEKRRYKVAENLSKNGMSLPSGFLLTREQVKQVAGVVRSQLMK